MEKGQIWTIIGIALIVSIVASIGTLVITGNTIKVLGTTTSGWRTSSGTAEVYTKAEVDAKLAGIKANSCDADSICEVAKTVSTNKGSTSALVLTSDIKSVIVDGSLSAGNVNINGKTVSTNKGSTSALILTSDVKKVVVGGSLSIDSLANFASNGTAYVCVNSYGDIYRSLTACN